MAEHPIWRGHLRLALVTCPVALYSTLHESGNLHFHYINPATGNRVRMVTEDAETGEELSRRDLVRGYEFRKNEYVLLDEADFESARIDSSATLNVEKFVPAGAVHPIYFESSYYLVPDGDAGIDVYVVLRDAIRRTGHMALSRLVIARRERAVALLPMDRGMVLHTLHEARDLADPHTLFGAVPDTKPDPEMVRLAVQLIGRQTAEFDAADMEDRYEARLRAVIDAKLRGEGITPEAAPAADQDNVIDLMQALKRSLGGKGAAEGRKAGTRPASGKRPAADAAEPKGRKRKVPATKRRRSA